MEIRTEMGCDECRFLLCHERLAATSRQIRGACFRANAIVSASLDWLPRVEYLRVNRPSLARSSTACHSTRLAATLFVSSGAESRARELRMEAKMPFSRKLIVSALTLPLLIAYGYIGGRFKAKALHVAAAVGCFGRWGRRWGDSLSVLRLEGCSCTTRRNDPLLAAD